MFLRSVVRRAAAFHRLAAAASTTRTATARCCFPTARCFSSDGGKGRYEKEVTADARRGREAGWSLEQMIKQEFQGDAAQALGKSGDKVSRALADLAAAGSAATAALKEGNLKKLELVAAYNAAWKQAFNARQALVIQREASGMGGGKVGVLRVDVVKDSMGGGPGASADDVVRQEYPLPKRMARDGRFVALASEAYTG